MIKTVGRSALCLALAAGLAGPALAQADEGWVTSALTEEADAARTPIALQFRKVVELAEVPSVLNVEVSADNRFVLYVNGQRVADGPSRGEWQSWRYETIDIAPYLTAGANVIAAEVWNDGEFASLAQLTGGRTAFLFVAADDAGEELLGGGAGWQVRIDRSRTVGSGMRQLREEVGGGFYAAGGPETITGSEISADWNAAQTSLTDWHEAEPLMERPTELTLIADELPQMRYDQVPAGTVVRSDGVDASGFPDGPVTIPANSQVNILVDAGRVLAAYPALITSGGAGAQIDLTYTEALYGPERITIDGNPGAAHSRFTDRARVDDGLALGLTDTFLPAGGSNERLAPFWWRGWRFAELTVTTGDEPLTLEDFEVYETGYPFEQRGYFRSNDPDLERIWQIGWDTALFDAHETYMDTAYWEQLQYIGDTRIQMLMSYDVSGDTRLAEQALRAPDASRVVEGLPQSAWPESNKNVIPPFALLWIGSLHDYWMRHDDTQVISDVLDGTRYVLDWYSENLAESGIVQESSGWPFVDWTGHLSGWEYRGGTGPESCVITMIYYGALGQAAELEQAVGDPSLAPGYLAQAERLRGSLGEHCWDGERGLYSDTPDKELFSQHAAILAVLYDLVPEVEQRAMMEKVTLPEGGIGAPEGMLASTYYFSFYLAQALDHAGMTDRYLDMLQPWRAMLAQNFTTFPETPDPTRSDTHAWAGHPTSGMFAYIAGVEPAAPGYSAVRIEPHLGELTMVDAGVVHPDGMIQTKYEREGNVLDAQITLPDGLSGSFSWKGVTRLLEPGLNAFTVEAAE